MNKAGFSTVFGIATVAILVLGFIALNLYRSNRELTTRLDGIDSQLADVGHQLEHTTGIFDLFRDISTVDDSDVDAIRDEQNEFKRDLTTNQKQGDRLGTDVNLLKSDKLRQSHSIDRLENEITLLKRANKRLERELQSLQREGSDKLSREVSNISKEVDLLKRRLGNR